MADYHNKIGTYVELISDDFESTFVAVDENTLNNMLGLEGDIESVTKIIHKYVPDAKLEFIKTNQIPGDYDIYIIRDTKETK